MDDEDAELRVKWGANIARLRTAQEMSQAKLARAVDLDSMTISRIERGLRGVSTKTQIALARALKVEVHELFEYPPVTEDVAS